MNDDKLLNEMAQYIVNSWNFCGNSREAAKQVFDDHGMKWNEDIYFQAVEKASEIWNEGGEK